jgi:hypothetical protein
MIATNAAYSSIIPYNQDLLSGSWNQTKNKAIAIWDWVLQPIYFNIADGFFAEPTK